MRLILSLFTILALWLAIFSCSPSHDPVLDTSSEDKENFNQYWDLYSSNSETNPDSALYFANEIESLAKENKNQRWLAFAYWAKAYEQQKKGLSGEAIYNSLLAAKIYKKLGLLSHLGGAYFQTGSIYLSVKDYETAFSYLKRAEDIYHYEGTTEEKILVNKDLAYCFTKKGNFDQAKKKLAIAKELGLKAKNYSALSKIFNTWGILYLELKDYESAREYFHKAIHYADSSKTSPITKAMAINNIGETFLYEGKFLHAEEWLNQAITNKESLNNPLLTQTTINLLSKALIKKGNYIEAFDLLDKGLRNLDSATVNSNVDEGLTLMAEALVAANAQVIPGEKSNINEKFSSFSKQLTAFNRNQSKTKEELETISRQLAIEAAVERYAFNEQLEASEAANQKMKYAFLIPVFLLIVALVSVYLAVKKNMHYKKLYSNIEQVLNKSKALRHLK